MIQFHKREKTALSKRTKMTTQAHIYNVKDYISFYNTEKYN